MSTGEEWLSDSDLAILEKKPWLRLYLAEGDTDLIAARARYKEAQNEARVQLRKKGKEPHRRMVAVGAFRRLPLKIRSRRR